MGRVYKNLCPATISASIMAMNMWKNGLKKVEFDNNKILQETLLDFLQRNGTYFLNKPRIVQDSRSLQSVNAIVVRNIYYHVKAQQLVYIRPGLKNKDSAYYPQFICVSCDAISSVQSMRQFFFLMKAHGVASEVRNVSLYPIIQINFISQKSSTAYGIRLDVFPTYT